MTFNASISLAVCGNYDTPSYAQILHPADRTADINFNKGLLHSLVCDKPPIVLHPVEIEGGWDARRYKIRLAITQSVSEHYSLYQVIYGYTEPCDEVTDDTKIHLTRVTGLRVTNVVFEDRQKHTASVMFDILLTPQVGKDLFRLTPISVFQRLASEQMFGQLVQSNAINTINNRTGAVMQNTATFPVANLTAEGWATEAENLLKQLNNSTSPYLEDDAKEHRLSDIAYGAERHHLENVPFLKHLRSYTDWSQSGELTYGELLDACGEHTSVSVNYTQNHGKSSVNPPEVAKQLFDQFARRAIAEASALGLECIHSEWWSDGFTLQSKGVLERPFFLNADWIKPETPRFDVSEGARIVDAYNLKTFHVSMLVNVSGDTFGRVQLDDGQHHEFYVPTFAFSLANGLMVSEATLDDTTRMMDHAVEHHLHR